LHQTWFAELGRIGFKATALGLPLNGFGQAKCQIIMIARRVIGRFGRTIACLGRQQELVDIALGLAVGYVVE